MRVSLDACYVGDDDSPLFVKGRGLQLFAASCGARSSRISENNARDPSRNKQAASRSGARFAEPWAETIDLPEDRNDRAK